MDGLAGLALLSQPEAPAILILGEVARCPEEVIPAIALHSLQAVRSEIQTQNSHRIEADLNPALQIPKLRGKQQ